MISKAYSEGLASGRQGRAYRNPYSAGSDDYNDFERAWVQTVKSGENVGKMAYESAYDSFPKHSQAISDIQRDKYLKAKGKL